MIAVDTSALMSILLAEPGWRDCMAVLIAEEHILISGGTLAEALIVAARRGKGVEMAGLIDGLSVEVVPVGSAESRRVAQAYGRWGKGVHPAGLNLGDCFAYALADERTCPLLFVGNDFSRTDLKSCF